MGALDFADLNLKLRVKLLMPQPLRFFMSRVLTPRLMILFGVKLHERHSLAIGSRKRFYGNEPRHRFGQGIHTLRHGLVLGMMLGSQTRAKNRQDHGLNYNRIEQERTEKTEENPNAILMTDSLW